MHPVDLNALRSGSFGLITGLRAEAALERRLLALGFRPGRQVEMLRKASLAGPLHVRVGTTEVMVRRRDAHAIEVQPQPQIQSA
jgi:ferrous iron transport protein A